MGAAGFLRQSATTGKLQIVPLLRPFLPFSTSRILLTASSRGAIETAPNVEVASSLQGNLGALLMAGGRVQEALGTIEESLDAATAAGHDRTDNFAGILFIRTHDHRPRDHAYPVQLDGWFGAGAMFNKGKALGMLGREAEAQATYRQAMKVAKGVSPSTWTKCCASLKKVTDDELDEIDAAATFLTYGTGIRLSLLHN